MKFKIAKTSNAPIIDLLGGSQGVFPDSLPLIDDLITNSKSRFVLAPHDLFDVWGNVNYLHYLREIAEESQKEEKVMKTGVRTGRFFIFPERRDLHGAESKFSRTGKDSGTRHFYDGFCWSE